MKLSSLESIVSALNAANVRYVVVGGLAVAAHGHGRATFDIDLVVQLQPENVSRALRALESLGYKPTAPVPAAQFADPERREAWIRDKNMVVFQLHSDRHPETQIDLFVSEPFDFDFEYEHAMVGEVIPEVRVRFLRLDALVDMKLAVGRPKDLEDVRQLQVIRSDQKHD
jgi:hypothetical protein